MVDFLILLPSYNRPDGMRRVIDHLLNEAGVKDKVAILVCDDCSHPSLNYRKVIRRYQEKHWLVKHIRLNRNFGRNGFWMVWDHLLKEARNWRARYYVGLADDLILCKNFLERTSRAFDFLRAQDEKVVAMNLCPIWPTNWGFSRYIDGAFIGNHGLMAALQFQMMPITTQFSKDKFKNRGSGVGQQMTVRIKRAKKHIAMAGPVCWVKGSGVPSVMFPKADFPSRSKNKPFMINFIDDVGEDNE